MRLRCYVASRADERRGSRGMGGGNEERGGEVLEEEGRKGAAAVELWLRKRTTSTVLRSLRCVEMG